MDANTWFLVCLSVVVVGPFSAVLLPSLLGETMLGIDLGTTYSVAAVCHRGNVTIAQIGGENTMPSVVYFGKGRPAEVGYDAAAKRALFPQNTVYDAKRIIGRNLTTDALAQLEVSELPYRVVDLGNGSIGIKIPGVDPVQTPQTVGSVLLAHLKKTAEEASPWRKMFGFRFKSATVSVPVGFTHEQRAATVRAGEAAGFRMVRLLEEPVAAAIAFGLHRGSRERTALVYDMGGGTLDVALLRLE
eukprot:CAMPEP_0118942566 /NCGR_PEP_ID=MMETSP1169-20130426/36426_1 /TAXON_ID=36882 /ORGANISM="Pyramimonas obovata, Strain CCMP722" /LENGTH=244 /DNA_ID=CAMNT_0006887603 /DNA_START=55 /DNA_END=786 /DNA_ORIENTATION=+